MYSKAPTPGYKSVLITQESFDALQLIQKTEKPARLSVGDLADAAIALQIKNGEIELLLKARELVIASLSQAIPSNR